MSDMPDVIWANQYPTNSYHLNSGTYHSRGAIRTEYIRADITESLYDALKMACMRDPGWELHAQAAIEAYRKAKGE